MTAAKVTDAGFAEPSMPRSNGAPVFDAPWQARALAMAVLVVERTGHEWNDFRSHLVGAIQDDPSRPYWESWVAALDGFVGSLHLRDSPSEGQPG